jgi:tetratricopeptide (TPR) repeat protein
MIERDYIMRMMQQLAAVVARLFRLKEQEEYDQALQEVEKAYSELLGMNPEIVPMFDAATLATLLGHPEKMKAMAALFFEQAGLHRLKQEPEKAQRLFQRALEMFLEALLTRREEDAECRDRIQSLLEIVEVNRLAARYKDALRRLQLLNE